MMVTKTVATLRLTMKVDEHAMTTVMGAMVLMMAWMMTTMSIGGVTKNAIANAMRTEMLLR